MYLLAPSWLCPGRPRRTTWLSWPGSPRRPRWATTAAGGTRSGSCPRRSSIIFSQKWTESTEKYREHTANLKWTLAWPRANFSVNYPFSLILISPQDSNNADSLPSESRRRPRKQKFQGVPGIAGRDFPTLGSIPMTRSNFGYNFSLLKLILLQFLMYRNQCGILCWSRDKLPGIVIWLEEIFEKIFLNFVYFELCVILLAVIGEYYGCEA